MNMFEKYMEKECELTIYLRDSTRADGRKVTGAVYKRVNITDVLEDSDGVFMLELTNSPVGRAIYGNRQVVLNAQDIQRIQVLDL